MTILDHCFLIVPFLNIKVMNGEENSAKLSSLTVIYKMSDVCPSETHPCFQSFFLCLNQEGYSEWFL